ncbi:MAG: hypothetical protein V1820_06400 [archaeon]
MPPLELSKFLKGLYEAAGGTRPPHNSQKDYFDWWRGERYDFSAAKEFALPWLASVYGDAFQNGLARSAEKDSEYPDNWWCVDENASKGFLRLLKKSKTPQALLARLRPEIEETALEKAGTSIECGAEKVSFKFPIEGFSVPAYANTGVPIPPDETFSGKSGIVFSRNDNPLKTYRPVFFHLDFYPYLFPKPIGEGLPGAGEIWSHFGNYNGRDYQLDVKGNWSRLGVIQIAEDGGAVFWRTDLPPYRDSSKKGHIHPLTTFSIRGPNLPSSPFQQTEGITALSIDPFSLYEGDLEVFFRHIGYDEVLR